MENISYIGLSQQLAVQQQMEMTASNIANMSTPGYKAQRMLFTDYIQNPAGGDAINQTVNIRSYRNLSPGAMSMTQNTLDVALGGEGWFSVETPGGPKYTRNGGFALNAEREIVNKAGLRIQGDGGGAIVIPADATQIRITADGTVATEQGEIGRLKIVTFADPQNMTPEGENLYSAGGQAEVPVARPQVTQGAVEGSNVNAVLEMNRMIELLRLFQASQRMMQNDHERIRNTIQKLTRV